MPNPEQQTINLRTEVPTGWQISGFSSVKSDGTNPYRIPQRLSEIKFSTTGARYLQFQYQLFSPDQAVHGHVMLDGQDLGHFDFPAGEFKSFFPTSLIKAGQHVLRFEQECSPLCSIHQYHAEVKLVALPSAQYPAGLQAQSWNLDSFDSSFLASGLSDLQFDGKNYFRSLDSSQSAVFSVPKGFRATELHTRTISDSGAYQLRWTTQDGLPLKARMASQKTVLPKGQYVDQDIQLVEAKNPSQISVQIICQSGNASCLPIRFYFTKLATVSTDNNWNQSSLTLKVGSLVITLILLALFAVLLRPAPSKN